MIINMSKNCLVAVDIRSSHNIGSMFRTADGFSADMILTGICPRPLGDKNDDRLPHIANKAHASIQKTALGAEKTVSWNYFKEAKDAISSLKKQGYLIAAIEQHPTSLSLHQLSSQRPIALVLGTEVEGLSEEILKLCDSIYEIPMIGTKESYNVSIAAGIALYQTTLN
jgi:23S rRNA (guanosine2251-2'-O)-methyltransferase